MIMDRFDAWYTPGFQPGSFEKHESGRTVIRTPKLAANDIATICARLKDAGAVLRDMPVSRIVAAIDAAATLLAESPLRAEALRMIPLTTGLSPEMATLVFERMVEDWKTPALLGLIQSELGSLGALNGFVARSETATRTHAVGPDLCFHVFSGNVPGVAVTSLIRALLVKSPSLCKSALREPALAVLFLRALETVDPVIAGAAAVAYWPGGTRELEQAAAHQADAVVVYGGGTAVNELRALTPLHTRFIEHGPRFSIGVVNKSIHDARDIATAVATFDQQGCVSPHIIYVLGSAMAAREVARATAHELEQVEARLPRGRIEPGESAAIHSLRAQYEFRTIAGAGTEVYQSAATEWTVVVDPEPGFQPSCLNRFVLVKPIASLDALITELKPHAKLLQSVGISGFDDAEAAELGIRLGRLGAVRIAPFSTLPWPPPWWHHDGRGPLLELIRWVDLD